MYFIMIPKIIHRMWLDKKIKNNLHFPKKYEKFVTSFDQHNPDFLVYFWNMEKVKNLFVTYPEIQKYRRVWSSLPYHIQKCDMARFLILYIHGGLYIDLDFMCFKNLSPLLNRDLLLTHEPIEYSDTHQNPVNAKLFNGFIGSVPKHPFWIDWLDFICESLKKTDDVLHTTGAINFKIFLEQSRYKNVPILSNCDILPLHWFDDKVFISKECIHRNNNSKIVTPDYHKKFGNYAHTKWLEGSNWGMEQWGGIEQLQDFDDPHNYANMTNESINKNTQDSSKITYIMYFIIVLVLASAIYFICIHSK